MAEPSRLGYQLAAECPTGVAKSVNITRLPVVVDLIALIVALFGRL